MTLVPSNVVKIEREGDVYLLTLRMNGEVFEYALTPNDENGMSPALRQIVEIIVTDFPNMIQERIP